MSIILIKISVKLILGIVSLPACRVRMLGGGGLGGDGNGDGVLDSNGDGVLDSF